jgi:signal transduction histidine kinase
MFQEALVKDRRPVPPPFKNEGASLSDLTMGRMAHDLRNVLQIISGNLALLSCKFGDDAAARKHIDRAIAGCDLGTRLTGDVLERGASFSGSTCIPSASADLEALLIAAAGPGVAVRLTIPARLAKAAAGMSDIQNTLINLAINARDAMEGRGVLNVSFANVRGKRGDWIDLSVSDTGCGMPPEVVAKALEPFFTTKGRSGSGLGLASVKRFVDGCGGSLSIESEVGRGTTFRLRLPATS